MILDYVFHSASVRRASANIVVPRSKSKFESVRR